MIHSRTSIKRPTKEIIEKFKNVSVASVYEASGRKGYVDCDIKPIDKDFKICGPAFTIQCAPGDNLMLHKGLSDAQKGDVLITTTGGAYKYGYWGEMMSVSAKARGIEGLVIDGCVRDGKELREMKFPVFARGQCIRGTVKNNLGLINYPINFGGTVVNPGDIIIGDEDGIVVVNKENDKEILDKAIKREEEEIEKAKILRSGMTSVEYKGLDEVFKKLGLVEE